MTDLALFDVAPFAGPRCRPHRYVVVSRFDLEVDPDAADFADIVDWDDGAAYATVASDCPDDATPDDGLWDNWGGEWVTAPEWADSLDLGAEGSARYDLRPAEQAVPPGVAAERPARGEPRSRPLPVDLPACGLNHKSRHRA